MNRFFRSALFPLIVIVLLVYLASQTLIHPSKSTEKQTYSSLIQLVKNDPGSIKEVVFNPSKLQVVATLNDQDAKKIKVNYPSDQSQIQFQNLLAGARRSTSTRRARARRRGGRSSPRCLPFVLLFGFWIFLMNRCRAAARR